MEQKFKIGDKVRVVSLKAAEKFKKDCDNPIKFKIGDEGIVEKYYEFHEYANFVQLKIGSEPAYWYHPQEDLELITNNNKTMEYKVNEEFIKDHKAACSGWKKKIEEQFPSVFEVEGYAIKTPIDYDYATKKLQEIFYGIEVLYVAANKRLDVGRGFFLSKEYDWEFKPAIGGGYSLVPKIKNKL
jgi:hypothetical protein